MSSMSSADPAHGDGDQHDTLTEATQQEVASRGIRFVAASSEPVGRWASELVRPSVGSGAYRSITALDTPPWSGVRLGDSPSPTRTAEVDQVLVGAAVGGGHLPVVTLSLPPAKAAERDAPCPAVPAQASAIRWGVVSGPVLGTAAPAAAVAFDPVMPGAEVHTPQPTDLEGGEGAE